MFAQVILAYSVVNLVMVRCYTIRMSTFSKKVNIENDDLQFYLRDLKVFNSMTFLNFTIVYEK